MTLDKHKIDGVPQITVNVLPTQEFDNRMIQHEWVFIKASIDPNGMETRNSFTHLFDLLEYLFATFALTHIGRRNEDSQHQSQRIYCQKPLPALDQLATIKSHVLPDHCRSFDTLAVNDRLTRTGKSVLIHSEPFAQMIMNQSLAELRVKR